jgi:RNA polymerase subunit RPABC4/transcription elongation factor Spt4
MTEKKLKICVDCDLQFETRKEKCDYCNAKLFTEKEIEIANVIGNAVYFLAKGKKYEKSSK